MYKLIKVGDNTFYIDCPARVGIYRLKDNNIMLIDSGNDEEVGKEILKIIEDKNWTLESIILTHAHIDHIGGSKVLHNATGCKIYATKIEKVFAEFPSIEPSYLYGAFPYKKLRETFRSSKPLDLIDIDDFQFPAGMEIFNLPGHFFEMIGVRTPDDIIFLADSVISEAMLRKQHIAYLYDIKAQLETLNMLKRLRGKLFVPAHTKPLEDMTSIATANEEKIIEIIKKIESICKTPASFDIILKTLFDEYGLRLGFTQYIVSGGTIKSYLSYMLDEGLLKVEFKENIMFWCSTSV